MGDASLSYTTTSEDLQNLAHTVLTSLRKDKKSKAAVLLLEGDLGAGKTTFTQALARELGVSETVISPTFILKKTYQTEDTTFKNLVHVDAYRFGEPKESKVLRIEEDVTDPHTLIVVEWPNNMTYLKGDAVLQFSVVDETTRKIDITYEKEH
jgi:tRNA threonylcarbamoyladenosine biosynthesis protein TsaE